MDTPDLTSEIIWQLKICMTSTNSFQVTKWIFLRDTVNREKWLDYVAVTFLLDWLLGGKSKPIVFVHGEDHKKKTTTNKDNGFCQAPRC